MKTKTLLIFAILAATISISAYAVNPQSMLQQTINSHIEFPKTAIEKQIEGVVYAEFTVNKDGKVEVINCFSAQGELQSYVFNELSSITVTPDIELTGKNFVMKFEFKLV